MPPTAQATTPDGTVVVAAHSPDDQALAADVTRAVDGLLAGGAVDLRRRSPRHGTGWVALVGGGPGADGLLTGRGRELLAAADVVVVDRLAPRGVIARLPSTVRVVDVGKAPGRHALSQELINELLVDEALAGHAVVRLKGGDPYVLGRGGEERLACEAHGIRVEVVPGVTSAVAVPAAAGIPVTHRGVARGFTVVTGHDELPAVPPGTDHTVVLLMGVGRLARSARSLLDGGRPASCPVAVVEQGFLPEGLLNYLALLGWGIAEDRDVFTMAEMAEAFDIRRVNPNPARFDLKKLEAINAAHIRLLSVEELEQRLLPFLAGADLVSDPPTPEEQAFLQLLRDTRPRGPVVAPDRRERRELRRLKGRI